MSTPAIWVVLGAVVSLICSAVYFPLALVIAALVLVVAVRGLRAGAPDRGWYVTATVVALVSTASSVLGAVLVNSQ